VRIAIAVALAVILVPSLGLAGVGHAEAQAVAVAVVTPVPIWGVVLGTVLVAGLLYLMVHGPDGGYYRYPYYGEYYRHYYRPVYRPYLGFWPSSALIVSVAPPVAGIVLGIVIVAGHHYILSRDPDGRVYRYPYYGPYRQVYYKPAFHDYHGTFVTSGAYRTAPLRQGDAHWDGDKRILAPDYQRPHPMPAHQPQPNYHQQPNHQPQYNYNHQQPNHQPQPNYRQQPNHQPQYNNNHQQPSSNQHGGRDSANGGHRPQQCGHQGEPACPDQHP
jgi:hypothetical protein